MLYQIKKYDCPTVSSVRLFVSVRHLAWYRLVSFFIFGAFIFSCKVGEEDFFVIYLAFTAVTKCGLLLLTAHQITNKIRHVICIEMDKFACCILNEINCLSSHDLRGLLPLLRMLAFAKLMVFIQSCQQNLGPSHVLKGAFHFSSLSQQNLLGSDEVFRRPTWLCFLHPPRYSLFSSPCCSELCRASF